MTENKSRHHENRRVTRKSAKIVIFFYIFPKKAMTILFFGISSVQKSYRALRGLAVVFLFHVDPRKNSRDITF